LHAREEGKFAQYLSYDIRNELSLLGVDGEMILK
jgi:hypothetical protein